MELVLEGSFLQMDNTYNKLQTLCEYIDDTEARPRAWNGRKGRKGRKGKSMERRKGRPALGASPCTALMCRALDPMGNDYVRCRLGGCAPSACSRVSSHVLGLSACDWPGWRWPA